MIEDGGLLLGLGTHSPYVHQLFHHLFKEDQSLLLRAERELNNASVCQKCGVTGYEELLVYCRKCKTFAEHRYCLNNFPKKDEKVNWFCEKCEPGSSNIASPEKLVVSGRSKADLEYNDQQPNYSDSVPRPEYKKQKISGHRKTVSLPKLQNDVTSGSQHVMIEAERSPSTSPEQSEGRKLERQRSLILAGQNVTNKATDLPSESVLASPPYTISTYEVTIGSRIVALETAASKTTLQESVHDEPNVLYNQASVNQHLCSAARPIIQHVWRGCISFGDKKYGPLTAHISSIACERVFDAANLLPPFLHMEKLSRLDYCPNIFKNAPPTDDKIGLYFFADGTMLEPALDQLLDDVIQKDLVFRFMLDEVELLVFSSTILTKDHHKFQGKYYLWGSFRGRQASVSTSSANCHLKPTELIEESQRMQVSNEHAGDKEEGEGRDFESSDVPRRSNFAISPVSLLQHPKSNKFEALSSHAVDEEGIEARVEETGDLGGGEICDEYVDREEGMIPEGFEEGHCLELFPLAIEDLGIVSRIGTVNELNLELGLSQ